MYLNSKQSYFNFTNKPSAVTSKSCSEIMMMRQITASKFTMQKNTRGDKFNVDVQQMFIQETIAGVVVDVDVFISSGDYIK